MDVADSNSGLDISVLIATYNRAEILRQTLESMTHLDRDGLSVEFVVIDNNSSDNTEEVIKSFSDRLSIRYLFEPQPGKNCALNKALDEVGLGRLVVFTDDDVEPQKDWLQSIISTSKCWTQYSVFGGKQYPIFPPCHVPKWACHESSSILLFAKHDYGDKEFVYPTKVFPFGANFWVRREVFACGLCFNENIGPRPKNRIMGSETSFLKLLAQKGYGMVYSPRAVVGHRIQSKQISIVNLLMRAYRSGRGAACIGTLCRKDLFDKHPILWYMIRIGVIFRMVFRFAVSLVPLAFQRPGRTLGAMGLIGYNVESFIIAMKR